jgi:hypothetical protein
LNNKTDDDKLNWADSGFKKIKNGAIIEYEDGETISMNFGSTDAGAIETEETVLEETSPGADATFLAFKENNDGSSLVELRVTFTEENCPK